MGRINYDFPSVSVGGLEYLYGGQFTISTQFLLDKTIDLNTNVFVWNDGGNCVMIMKATLL